MSHNLLEIMNVKQGDCLILRPRNCQFSQDTFLVDTGDGRCDFTPSLATDQNIHIMLTHAHADHINGFTLMLTEPNFSKIKSLILPYYHNESVLIAKALLNLKGMETLSDKWGLKKQLGQVVANQRLLINVAQKIKIVFVKDTDSLCNHIHILNPPCLYKDYLSKLDDSTLIELSNLFSAPFASELLLYFRMSKNNNNISDAPSISRLFINHTKDDVLSEEPAQLSRANFFVEFLLENRQAIVNFNEHATGNALYRLNRNRELKDHQACLVFKYNYCDYCDTYTGHGSSEKAFLFAGDADCSVWNRLIRETKDISAYYLKVPHHGSKNNISKKILTKIAPKIAIISHDNGLFGKAKDPHPNEEVLALLEKLHIKLISTNNIKKSGKIVWDCRKDNAIDPNIDLTNL